MSPSGIGLIFLKENKPISVSTPENIGALFSHRRVRLKYIAETLRISYYRVHHIVLDNKEISGFQNVLNLCLIQRGFRVTMDETWKHF